MGYIYKICNDINEKLYIGKTVFSLEKRFKEHCRDSEKRRYEHRPQYSAMRKYGIEHFFVSLIEECPNEVQDEREQFWINKYDTYNYGYNATMGGEGKIKIDYNLVLDLWNDGCTIIEIAKQLNIDRGWCHRIVQSFGVSKETIEERCKQPYLRKIKQIDKDTGAVIGLFKSIADAKRSVGKEKTKAISNVQQGHSKSAFGYYWEYAD